MIYRLGYVAALLVGLTVALMLSQGTSAYKTKSAAVVNSKSFSELLFARADVIVLLSHDGTWIGKDGDIEIQLHRDGSMRIIDYGFAVTESFGRYEVNTNGSITLSPVGKPPWAPQPFSIENGMLMIWPEPKEEFFKAARKFGIDESLLTDAAYDESFEQWPFRQVLD